MCLNILCSFPDFLKHIPKANDKDEIELGSNSKLKILIVLSLAFITDEDYFLKWYPVNSQNTLLINSVRRKCWVLPCGLICINGSCNVFFFRSLQQKAFAAQPSAPPPVSNQPEDNSKHSFWAYPIFG